MNNFIDEFHLHYYNSKVWLTNTKWLGTPIQKLPLDLFIYQEMIYEVKPDLIIECGTYNGGSTLFFASMLDLINKGKVISIDINPQPNLPYHHRVTYLKGSSTSDEILNEVKKFINPNHKVMVILDSDHTKEHVLKELRLYNEFVTKDSYLIVEDTNVNGHPVLPDFGPGPMEALEEFLKENDRYIIDFDKNQKFFVTFHPRGFLRKIK